MDTQTMAARINEHAAHGYGMEVEDTGGRTMVGMSDVVRGRWVEAVVDGDTARVAVRSHDDDGAPEWADEVPVEDAGAVESVWQQAVSVAHAERCEVCDGVADGTVDVPGRGPVPMCDRHAWETPVQACAVCSAPVHEAGDVCDGHDVPMDPATDRLAAMMAPGHLARTGHTLRGHYVTDGGIRQMVRHCC